MSLPGGLAESVQAALGPTGASSPVTGGDINEAWRVELVDGASAFVKANRSAPAGMFSSEAWSLRWLTVGDGPVVPRVLAIGDDPPPSPDHMGASTGATGGLPVLSRPSGGWRWLALEWVEPGSRAERWDEAMGRALAALHTEAVPTTALPVGTFLGPLPLDQRAAEPDDVVAWWARRRVEPLLALTVERGALPAEARGLWDGVRPRLAHLVPDEPPVRLHGDLWAGNAMSDAQGRPVVVDPAASAGHREVDLAMMRLFGGFGPHCFAAYEEARPLAPGADERVALWQLVPLLAHAALFGPGWGERALATLRSLP